MVVWVKSFCLYLHQRYVMPCFFFWSFVSFVVCSQALCICVVVLVSVHRYGTGGVFFVICK